MSPSESADLLSRLYNELAQRIVQQCAQEFQTPGFLSSLTRRSFGGIHCKRSTKCVAILSNTDWNSKYY